MAIEAIIAEQDLSRVIKAPLKDAIQENNTPKRQVFTALL